MPTIVIIAHIEEDIDTLDLQVTLAEAGLTDMQVEVYQSEVDICLG